MNRPWFLDVAKRQLLAEAVYTCFSVEMTVRARTKIAFLRKLQVCQLAKRWQILHSYAGFQAVSAFLHTLGR